MSKFTTGVSGNKAGRPPGTKDKRTEMRELLQPHAGKLIQKAVDLALDGDTMALKLCMDRICPALKPRADPVTLDIPNESTLTEQAAALYRATAGGEIGPDEAAALMAILSGQARITEIDELKRKNEELTQLLKALQPGTVERHYSAAEFREKTRR